MPSYETLDLIADAYIPALLLCLLVSGAGKTIGSRNSLRTGLRFAAELLALLIVVYGMLVLDSVIGIWPRLGLDYSTHSALAAALCFALWQSSGPLRWFWPLSLVCYGALMRYQQYHSWADMGSTLLYVVAAIALCVRLLGLFVKKVDVS